MERSSRRIGVITQHLIASSEDRGVLIAPTSNYNGYKNIIIQIRDKVALVTLNRPKALNALCKELADELMAALNLLDRDDSVHVIVITGSKKAFAAGADIKEMSDKSIVEMRHPDQTLQVLDGVTKIQKPIIAAVNGFALGGGCELAMMCDIILAGNNAKFGQPEVKIGTIPGLGGSQRLVRAIGKSRAMEMVLTGATIPVQDLQHSGLIARIVPEDQLVDEALKMAAQIASLSRPVISLAKECVNKAFDLNLTEGNNFERRVFHGTFGLHDQKEGMRAFVEKRPANWQHN